jgi:hypothetical protein
LQQIPGRPALFLKNGREGDERWGRGGGGVGPRQRCAGRGRCRWRGEAYATRGRERRHAAGNTYNGRHGDYATRLTRSGFWTLHKHNLNFKEREHLGVWDRHTPTLLSSFAVNTASLRPGLQQQRSGLELGTRVRVGPAQVKPGKSPDPARPGRPAHVPTVTPGPGPTRVRPTPFIPVTYFFRAFQVTCQPNLRYHQHMGGS